MPPEDPTADVIDIMLRRDGLVESLLEGPKDKRELVAALDISRSTVDRGVRELDALGLIEPCEEGYRPTLSGRLLAEEYEGFSHRIENMVSAREMLSVLPPDSEIDPVVLEGAELIPSNETAPHIPGSSILTLLKGADCCYGLTRAHSLPTAMDVMQELTVQQNAVGEHVFQSDAFEYLQSEHPEKFRELKESGNFEPFIVDSVPFGLFLIEKAGVKHVTVQVHGDSNKMMGVVINNSKAAVEWGERTYRDYKKRAERVDL